MFIPSLSHVPSKVWLALTAGPALFLVSILFFSMLFWARGVHATNVPERIAALAPHILLFVQASLAVLLLGFFANHAKVAWQFPDPSKAGLDIGVGLLIGATLGVLYLYVLAPLLETLQRTMGDFVPPGKVLPTVSRGLVLFFVANVLLAPLVEETLYRGIALPVLGSALGVPWAVVLSCVLFGLLHWVGGFWYMLLTGVVAGGLFAGLYLWRGSLLAPLAAHFALNLVEFVYAWRMQSDAESGSRHTL